jgi:hypothetical protein
MALLLIKMRDSANIKTGFIKGDVVEVRDDKATFGKKECLPRYLIIKVEGNLKDLEYLISPTYVVGKEDLEKYKERRYNFLVDTYVSSEQLTTKESSEKLLIDTYELSTIQDKTAI